MKLWFKLADLFRKEKLDAEMSEELRTHLELQARENSERGMTPDEARHAARLSFGGVEQIKERCRDERVRGFVWFEQACQDVRYALRTFARHPGFTSVIVVSLALGIGANTAIFSLLDAVLWKMLPVTEPEQLVFLERFATAEPSALRKLSGISHPLMEALERRDPTLEGATTSRTYPAIVNSPNGPEPVNALAAADDFYSLLGVRAAVGRLLQSGDVRGSERVALLSHGYWQRRYGGTDVIGSSIAINGVPHSIVGVTPPEFFGISPGETFDLSVPMPASDVQFRSASAADPRVPPLPIVVARMKRGVTVAQASQSLSGLLRQLIREEGLTDFTPDRIAQQRIEVRPASQGLGRLREKFSRPLFALMALVAVVLLVTCANVANLLLARAAARSREMAIRASVGAGRARLWRQLVTESLLLAFCGGALGLVVANGTATALVRLAASGSQPIVLQAGLDEHALLFTAAISMLTGLVFGLAPAWSAAEGGVAAIYGRAKRSAGALSLPTRLLVVAQMALSVVLLTGAGLFVRTLQNLERMDPGFRRDQLLLVAVNPQLAGLRGAPLADLYAQILERVATLPGVKAVSFERNQPLSGSWTVRPVAPPGYVPPAGQQIATRCEEVGPRYFETLGMRLVAGRDFRSSDDRNGPKVIAVNEAAAREFFAGRNPIGERMGPSEEPTRYEVIAIAADVRHVNLREPAQPTIYEPVLQTPTIRDTTFFIRTASDPVLLAPRVRQIMREANPNVPVMNVTTLDAVAARALVQERLLATLSSVFGGLALVLAGMGLGGVLLFAVARRTPEIGIRMALGATRGAVVGMILRESIVLVGIGLLCGVPGAIVAGRVAQGLLFGLSPADPVALGSASAILVVSAIIAATWPARRAASVDPIVALRAD